MTKVRLKVRLFAAAALFAFSAGAIAAPVLAEGEIRKVDKDAAKLTIKHGAIKNLDMMPMTMVFRVKDTSMLGQVKTGDKIRFSAEKIEGAITVTSIESVPAAAK